MDGPWEIGEWQEVAQGRRTDFQGIQDLLRLDGNLRRVVDEYPSQFIRYSKGCREMASFYPPARQGEVQVYLLYGPPGSGKTWTVMESMYGHQAHNLYRKSPGNTWWDGYNGQEAILIDDFSGAGSRMDLAYLLQILDRYLVQVEVKGSHTYITSKYIYITTNFHPSTWYEWKGRSDHYVALARRIDCVSVFDDGEFINVDVDEFLGVPCLVQPGITEDERELRLMDVATAPLSPYYRKLVALEESEASSDESAEESDDLSDLNEDINIFPDLRPNPTSVHMPVLSLSSDSESTVLSVLSSMSCDEFLLPPESLADLDSEDEVVSKDPLFGG